MAFWDSLTDFVTSDALQGALNLGAGAFDLYQGYSGMQQAQQLYDTSQKALQQQLGLAYSSQAQYEEFYKPIEELQATYALEDIEALRPLTTAQRDYGLQRGLYDIERAQGFYQPLEESVVEQLAEGVDPQEFMSTATMDVQRAFDRARAEQETQALRYGIDPSSGGFQSAIGQQGTAQALAEASARTQARRTAEDLDLAKKAQALNYARGIALPSTPTLSGQAALGAATSGLAGSASQAAGLGSTLGSQAQQQISGGQYALSNVSDYWGTNRG